MYWQVPKQQSDECVGYNAAELYVFAPPSKGQGIFADKYTSKSSLGRVIGESTSQCQIVVQEGSLRSCGRHNHIFINGIIVSKAFAEHYI